jgi:hypothetical protein
MKPVEGFEHGRVGPGLGLDDIEEVAGMDKHVGLMAYDLIYHPQEVVIDLLLSEVHATLGIEAVECCESQMGISDMDEFHRIILNGILWDIRGRGSG